MRFNLRLVGFQARNPERNYNTDMERLSAVRKSIEASITSATSERDGLQRRVNLYYAQASNLMDNTEEYGARSQDEEASITLAEHNAAMAKKRIAEVSHQVEGLQLALRQVDTMLEALDPGRGTAQSA